MNIRSGLPAALSLLAVGCSTTVEENDYSLQWRGQSARLVVVDAQGQPVAPFGGQYVGVPGYLFADGAIIFHPGVKRIRHTCPHEPGDIEVLDVAPVVSHEFKAGHRYELSCKKGWPSIRQIE